MEKTENKFHYEPTSVVMPVLNQLYYTQKCVDSILKNTPEEYELIIIDNGSTDGTKEYLSDLCSKHAHIKAVTNAENVGVAPAWNQGIQISQHDYIAIINNDIEIVYPNWLSSMQSTLRKDPNIYWTSPMTCYNAQHKPEFKISHYEQIIYDRPNGREYVVACCFMCPRKAFADLGPFDENFEVKFYEDLDYLARILSSGKKVKMCKRALVYHAVGKTSTVTVGGHGNEEYFNSKWSKTPYSLEFFAPHIKLRHIKRLK